MVADTIYVPLITSGEYQYEEAEHWAAVFDTVCNPLKVQFTAPVVRPARRAPFVRCVATSLVDPVPSGETHVEETNPRGRMREPTRANPTGPL